MGKYYNPELAIFTAYTCPYCFMKTIFTLLMLMIMLPASAQYSDSVHHMLAASATGSINKTQNSDAYLLSHLVKFGMRKKMVVLNAQAGWIYGQQQRQLSNNDVNASLDFNRYTRIRNFYYWGLGAYTSSYSLNINNQMQAGLGLAYDFIKNERAHLNISDGLIYERSDLRINDSTSDQYSTWRNSLRLLLRWSPNARLSFDATGFWQPSLENSDDYILRAQAGLKFKVWKWLNLNAAFNYQKFNRTQRENLLFTYGLQAEHYF